MVAKDAVYDLRLSMSGKGLPAGSDTGYALLDEAMAKGKLNWCRNVYFPGMTEVWTEYTAPYSYDDLFRDACAGYQP